MRFFNSFHYVQNDSELGGYVHLEGWFCSEAAEPPLQNANETINLSFRCKESHKINRIVLIDFEFFWPG